MNDKFMVLTCRNCGRQIDEKDAIYYDHARQLCIYCVGDKLRREKQILNEEALEE